MGVESGIRDLSRGGAGFHLGRVLAGVEDERASPDADDVRDNQRVGGLARSLRQARGLTQEQLAERCGLASDTIRRVELGRMAPSLTTLRKLCEGFGIARSTLFEAVELGERMLSRELIDLCRARSDDDIELAFVVLRSLFAELDRRRAVAAR